MKPFTTFEIIMLIALLILLSQYVVLLYAIIQKNTGLGLALKTMNDMQDHTKCLYEDLLKEEKLCNALAGKIKDYQSGNAVMGKIQGI